MKELIIENITWRKDCVKEMIKFQTTGRMPTKKPHFIKLMAPANLDESRQRQYVMQYLNMHYGEYPTNFTDNEVLTVILSRMSIDIRLFNCQTRVIAKYGMFNAIFEFSYAILNSTGINIYWGKMMVDFKCYQAKVENFEILGDDKCRELIAEYQKNNNPFLLDMIVKSYLRLVMKIANDYIGMGVDYDELVALGNVGLLEAVKKYDVQSNAKFCVYAGFHIRNQIRRNGLDKRDIVERPEWYRIKKRKCNVGCVSMEKQVNDNKTFGEMIASNQQSDDCSAKYEQDDMARYIRSLIDEVLNDIEQDIIKARYGFNGKKVTLKSLAAQYGYTDECIRQKEEIALKKMRNAIYKNA